MHRGFGLAHVAVLGQLWPLLTAWALPAVSEFTVLGDSVSELALGRFGVLQDAAFLVAGVSTLAAGVVVRRGTSGTRGSLAGSVLIGVYGLATLAMVPFPTDRIDGPVVQLGLTAAGRVHVAGALIGFIAVLTAMVVLCWTFTSSPHWRSLTPWSASGGVVGLALFVTQGGSAYVGLQQRLLVVTISGWLVLVVLRINRAHRRSHDVGVHMLRPKRGSA